MTVGRRLWLRNPPNGSDAAAAAPEQRPATARAPKVPGVRALPTEGSHPVMQRSLDRIYATHVGSLARPPALLDLMKAAAATARLWP
jgi:hypothetical protein